MGRKQSPILNHNKLKLGFFCANCSGGMSVTKVTERWVNSWDNNIRLAQLADEAGIEFLLPIARWIGYGGENEFQGRVVETVTWATGLLANTKPINVFATVHTAFIHPVVSAKQLATADQLGHGRLGLNIVAGWNKPEYDAFGIDLPEKHTDRYALAQEWFDVVKAIWNHNGPSDWNGKFYHLKGVYGFPRPYDGIPPIMNAAGSGEGREFAAGHGTYPLVGDPDTIAKEMEKIPASGFAGTTLSFVDYVKEFPYFRDEVMPRLERKGLREKFNGQAAAD